MSMGASSMDMSEGMKTSGEAMTTSQPVIQVDKMLLMKKKNALGRPQQILTYDEEQLNPQLNQQLKKQMKAQQKKARRQAEGGHNTSNNLMEEDDDMMQDEVVPVQNFQFNVGLTAAPIPDEDEEL